MSSVISPKYPKYFFHSTKTNYMLPHSSPHLCPPLAVATVLSTSCYTTQTPANELGKSADTEGSRTRSTEVSAGQARNSHLWCSLTQGKGQEHIARRNCTEKKHD